MFNKLKAVLACSILFTVIYPYANEASAQCGVPPSSGSVTISIVNNIVNTYYPGTGNPVAGTTTLTVGTLDNRGNSTPVSAGDLLLIIQMQGADLDTTNTDAYGSGTVGAPASGYLNANLKAGYYEYNTVASVAGSNITFSYPLANNYFNRDFSSTTSIQRYQVIRVPRYFDLKIKKNASVTCPAWDGTTGGVVVLDVNDVFTLLGTLDVSYKGFRGGGGKNLTGATAGNSNGAGPLTNTDYRWNAPLTNPANMTGGSKGEGIAGTPAYFFVYGTTVTTTAASEGYLAGSMGRGGPANGGGGGTDGSTSTNQYNSGGGGGGNGGPGGKGGSGWNGGAGDSSTYPTGGYGGTDYQQLSTKQFIMGGGGGAGSADNSLSSNEYSCSGGSGGGIIIVRATQYAGNGSVLADGSNAPGVTDTYTPPQNDAAGGGGAGGTIVMVTTGAGPVGLNNVTASAAGGAGGDMTNYYDYGPGGGGGGGVIITNGAFLSTDVTGGPNGLTLSGSPTGPQDNNYAATPGGDGQLITLPGPPSFINSVNPGSPCGTLPLTLTDFRAVMNSGAVNLTWDITNVINLHYFIVEYSADGSHFSALSTVYYQDSRDHYDYVHTTPSQKNYYRLKMVDDDGGIFYSKVLVVQTLTGGNRILFMYPNPAYSELTLKIHAGNAEGIHITVTDNTGRVVIDQAAGVQPGDNYLSLDGIEKLPAAMYTVHVKSPGIDVSEKLVIGKK